jgi:Caspase domain
MHTSLSFFLLWWWWIIEAGGACTSALLQVLYKHEPGSISYVQCLRMMRSELNRMGYDQIPQLTSSRFIEVEKPMYIVPPNSRGRRRAILIGINYTGQQGQLSGTSLYYVSKWFWCGCSAACVLVFGVTMIFFMFSHTHTKTNKYHVIILFLGCHNDVSNIKKYLIQHQGFPESDMLILVDDNRSHSPTRRNIEDAFARICQYSQDGDVVFVHYSGTCQQATTTTVVRFFSLESSVNPSLTDMGLVSLLQATAAGNAIRMEMKKTVRVCERKKVYKSQTRNLEITSRLTFCSFLCPLR